MLFDTHSHLHYPAFDPDRGAVLARARAAGVGAILVVGTGPADNHRALAVAREHRLPAAAGLHPSEAGTADAPARIRALVAATPVAAIGEIGLDYTCPVPAATQQAVFRDMLALAASISRPVIVHSREAAADTLALLREAGGPCRGVWHCFSGDAELAGEVLALGLHLSFTGNVTYRRNHDLRRALAAVPADRLLLETDCPFMPPEGRRGRRNEPAWLLPLAEAIAATRQETVAALTAATWTSACRLFGPPGEAPPPGDRASRPTAKPHAEQQTKP